MKVLRTFGIYLSTVYIGISSFASGFDLDSAITEIKAAPSWSLMSEKTVLTDGAKLLATLLRYVSISDQDARKLIKDLSTPAGEKFDSGNESKIYVLNRVLCNVPDNIDRNTWNSFGGWLGIPVTDKTVNLLFPLKQLADGTLELHYSYSGYKGSHYNGLAEFDFLIARFGRRTKKE